MCLDGRRTLLRIPQFILDDPACSSADDPSVFTGEPSAEYAINHNGHKCFVVDACLVPALTALWLLGIKTTGCCCGHGSGSGMIGLASAYDGHDKHLTEAPPYRLIEVVERRRHENRAYWRGVRDGHCNPDLVEKSE